MDTTEQVWYTPIVLGYIERDGAVLLSRRLADVHQGGKWEFPGGKVEPSEQLASALQREMREEVGVTVEVGEEIATTRFRYPDCAVELHLFRCRITSGEPAPLQVAEVRWTPSAALARVDFPPANAILLLQLASACGELSDLWRETWPEE